MNHKNEFKYYETFVKREQEEKQKGLQVYLTKRESILKDNKLNIHRCLRRIGKVA